MNNTTYTCIMLTSKLCLEAREREKALADDCLIGSRLDLIIRSI